MKFLLGTKEEMTQIYDENSRAYPVTAVKVGPLTVTQKKTKETDGYDAVQVGFGDRSDKHFNKALKGHLGKNGTFAVLKEFRGEFEHNVGDTINPDVFEVGDVVEVSGTSKGKGFQGVVKRHGFAGGRRTHGQKHSEREPGSIGATGPQRVLKGTRMAGRMGSDRVTVKNLKVMHIDADNGLVYIKGAIPGRRGTLIEIKG